jgi:hypothetical protein
MHREILYSHAYQLSSENKQANTSIDPDNTYIWRHSRHRLEAEEIRDSLLAVSGLLDPTAGSQHPFPPMHTWNYEQQNMFEADPVKFETDKRTVYQMVQRTVRPPFFILFDGPSVNASTEQRTNSLTPLQALYFMNGDFPKRAAGALSTKLLGQEAGPKEAAQKAFQMVYGRPPSAEEIERTTAFLAKASDAFSTQGAGSTEARKLAFEQFAKALFASNEFMFVD